jgi:DNA-binding response OmpR family regulator
MSFSPLRIFLVEDQIALLHPLRRYLQQLGHHVRDAADMTSALSEIPKNPVDLLISDIRLPDGDGWTLMRRLKPEARFLAVAASGQGTEEDRRKSHAAGFQHHLVKPFLPEELDPILEEAQRLARSRETREKQSG